MDARSARLALASLALVGVCGASVTTLTSTALFTDTATTGPSTIASGSVDLAVDGTAATTLAVAAMAPGDTSYGVVTVTNAGSLSLRYSGAASWSAGNALTSVLQLSVRSIAAPGATCDGSLAWGTGDVVSPRAATGSATSLALFGDHATGAQAGDRTLAAATSETFCVRLALPTSAGNEVANLTSDLTLQLAAEQTANNP